MAGQILVLGATGHVGRPLTAALVARGESVKAASRTARPVGGARAVRFDLADPSTFAAAFEGVDRAFVMAPTGTVEVEKLLTPVISAAAERGVGVVLMSAFGVDADDELPYRRIERVLAASGAPHAVVRPNWFSDNFHVFWKPALLFGQLALPAGDGKTSFVDTRDVAASAASLLTTRGLRGEAFDLTGPQALGYAEALAILGRALGRTLLYTPVEGEAFVALLRGFGTPEADARMMAAMFIPVRAGFCARVTQDVETLTGETPRALEAYARDHLADLVI
ncbi:SDR family oxidoreductase [Methylocella sp.]|uniref:SDR family oxidoreductase n=1 Tax=Methylocella sp. TaxID=1978226 RepID=UPI00378393C3